MAEPSESRRKVRSPSFPFISLRIALERARALYDVEKRSAVRPETAAGHWRYSGKSSGGKQTIAALRQYGLLEGEGTVRLTDQAVRLLLDEGSPERERLLQKAALLPGIHAKLWAKYGPALPEDSSLRLSLVLGEGFNDNTVGELIAEYRETLEFAKLLDGPQDEATNQPLPFPRLAPPPQAEPSASEVDPVSFPLLHDNAVEFRIRQKISPDEVKDLQALFEIWLKKIVIR